MFQWNLTDNIISLHNELKNKYYKHGRYKTFLVCDPKLRIIHKATVKDRLLHRAIYRILYPFFDKTFCHSSFSCRKGKGTHKALNYFTLCSRKISKNNTKPCWVLKCDIRKFFASINRGILINILRKYIFDRNILWLLRNIIYSFDNGLPLGNLTSQLFSNIYLNELDLFIKHNLKIKFYIRYADDFVILSDDKYYLKTILNHIDRFLKEKLRLSLHEDKIFIKSYYSGIDFLGWVHFPYNRVLRTISRRRLQNKFKNNSNQETIASYVGLLKHGNTYKLKKKLKFPVW